MSLRPLTPVLFESLEPRQLLAADLVGAWVGLDTLPAISSGKAFPAVTLNVRNTGDLSAGGAVAEVYLSSDDTLDPLADTKIGSLKLPKLTAGANKDVVFKKLKLLPGFVAGDYFLIARLDATGKVVEALEDNNDAVSPGTIPVQQPDYDLAGSLGKPTFNLTLVQGVVNSGKVKLTLNNPGTANIPSVKIGARFYLRPDGNSDASGDIQVGALNNKSASILAGGGKTLTASLSIPAVVPNGQYRLVAVFDNGGALAETDETNNTVIGTDVITLAGAFADLGITGGSIVAPNPVPGGSKTIVTVTAFNAGNVAAKGTIGVTLVAEADGQTSVPLLSISNIPVSVKAGFTKTVKVAFTVPLLLIDGVLYNVRGTITPNILAGGDVVENNTLVVGSGFIPDIPPVLVPEVGDRLVFSQEKSAPGDGVNGASSKTGVFVDGNGRTGTYHYSNNEQSPFETGALSLAWNDGRQPTSFSMSLQYGNEGGPHSLNGRKLRIRSDITHDVYGQVAIGFLTIVGYAEFT